MPLTPLDSGPTPRRLTALALIGFLLVSAGCGSASELGTAVTTPTVGASTTPTTGGPAMAPAQPLPTANGSSGSEGADDAGPETGGNDEPPTQPSSTIVGASARPDWLGTRVLPTTPDGAVVPQTTPADLVRRELVTIDTLPRPTEAGFAASAEALAGDPLRRSTWNGDCPVGLDELRYLRLTFWGFDGKTHQGEMIVNRDVAEEVIGVFRSLYEHRFPIEEMRIVTQADVDAAPTGDGNNTTSFVCRAVVGGSRFSEHAYGRAIDINPFQNPYQKGDVVLPELATSYLDRENRRPGMFAEGDPVISAFDGIGWGWGGRWSSLHDYHHFAVNDR